GGLCHENNGDQASAGAPLVRAHRRRPPRDGVEVAWTVSLGCHPCASTNRLPLCGIVVTTGRLGRQGSAASTPAVEQARLLARALLALPTPSRGNGDFGFSSNIMGLRS